MAHDEDHAHDAWFESLRQPDNPTVSCCGPADHYWCDDVHVRDGKTFCNITDARVLPGRTPVAYGREIEIPDRKLGNYNNSGNPTGHSIVFLNSASEPAVYCFVQGTLG